jgi:hypothetical protein
LNDHAEGRVPERRLALTQFEVEGPAAIRTAKFVAVPVGK